MHEPAAPLAPAAVPIDDAAELRVAWRLALLVLVVLTLVKPLGGVPVLGTVAFTAAAVLQLYLPLWRAGKLGRDWDWVGLHLRAWRADLRLLFWLCLATFPAFALGHHLYMTQAHDWALAAGLEQLAPYIPRRVLAPALPQDFAGLARGAGWLLQLAATHALGVALPEETFYRGYLQPRLESRFPPRFRLLGVPLGRAAVIAAALFALGHFLGEWNPMRLGPFFPALVFAWQRNATGSLLGAISFHALANVVGEVLFSLYVPAGGH